MNSLNVHELVELLHCLHYHGRDSAIRLQDVYHYTGDEGWGRLYASSFETYAHREPLASIVHRLQYVNHIPLEAILECLRARDIRMDE